MIASAPSFVQLVQEFFCEHLVNQRNASPCTVASYRDTFRLLLNFLGKEPGKKPSQLEMRDMTPSAVTAFLRPPISMRLVSIWKPSATIP